MPLYTSQGVTLLHCGFFCVCLSESGALCPFILIFCKACLLRMGRTVLVLRGCCPCRLDSFPGLLCPSRIHRMLPSTSLNKHLPSSHYWSSVSRSCLQSVSEIWIACVQPYWPSSRLKSPRNTNAWDYKAFSTCPKIASSAFSCWWEGLEQAPTTSPILVWTLFFVHKLSTCLPLHPGFCPLKTHFCIEHKGRASHTDTLLAPYGTTCALYLQLGSRLRRKGGAGQTCWTSLGLSLLWWKNSEVMTCSHSFQIYLNHSNSREGTRSH